jgi:hypothetical protein
MNKNITVLILFLISLIISDSNETDVLTEHYRSIFNDEYMNKVLGSEDTKKPDSEGGSSRDISIIPESNPPIIILREIVKPKRDGDFFRNEPIEVLVKIVVQKEGGLKQIEFWEDPGIDLDIINCSYPIRTSSIRQMRDYEERDQSLLRMNDIKDVNSIVNLLLNRSNNANSLVGDVYKMLSSNTTSLLIEYNQNKYGDSLSELLKQNLTSDFNKIITKNNSLNRTLLTKDKIAIDYTRVNSLNTGTSGYNESKDYCLQNRIILEHIFPNMLKNLSYIKKHEYLNISKNGGELQILEKNLRQGEIIIFKYYLLPIGLGKRDIRYIVRADGYYDEAIESFNILERGEKFSIEYQCDSKEVILNQKKKFLYSIEYLGGADEKSNFLTIITPPDGGNLIEASWGDRTKTKPEFKKVDESLYSTENISFSKGRIEQLSIIVEYNKMGLKMSPPDITIGDFPKRFEPDISVYADYDNSFRIHYESYSIILTVSAILISLIVAFFSSIEIYLTHREMMLTREQIKQATSEKEKSDRLMKKNLETLENLRRVINKLIGD